MNRQRTKLPGWIFPPLALAAAWVLCGGGSAGRAGGGSTAGAAALAPREATVAWLRQRAVALQVDGPPAGADLAAVERMIGATHVVALGEATHGTHEYLAVRNRIVEGLVERGEVTTLAVETGFREALPIDAYLGATGDADPDEATVRAMMSWSDDGQGPGRTENRALLRWLRDWNAAHPTRRVHLYGFDLSGRASGGGFPNAAAPVMAALDYVQRVDPALAADLRGSLGTGLASFRASSYGRKEYDYLPAAERDRITQAVAALDAAFRTHARAWQSATSPAEYVVAARLAEAARQLDAYFRVNFGRGGMGPDAEACRDSVMAANAAWVAASASPGRVFLFAHDRHVARGRAHSMGSHLAAALGRDLFVLGTLDAVRHRGGAIVASTLADPASAASACAETGLPAFVVGLRDAPAAGPAHDWLAAPRAVNPVSFAQAATYPVRLLDWYDGLIFVRDVHAAD